MKTIAVIGCGALARVFADAARRCLAPKYGVVGFLGRTASRARELAAQHGAQAYATVQELIEAGPDIVVEFAGGEAMRAYAQKILAAGVDLAAASIGALADEALRPL